MKKKSKFVPLFVMLVLAVVLIGMPLGSWYYLQSGLEFRKGLEVETKPKTKLKNSKIYKACYETDSTTLEFLTGKTSIIGNYSDELVLALKPIKEQFMKVENFEICFLHDAPTKLKTKEYYRLLNCPVSISGMVLINNEMEIIEYYDNTEESLKKLIQHIAVVLPPKKGRDIMVKNNLDN